MPPLERSLDLLAPIAERVPVIYVPGNLGHYVFPGRTVASLGESSDWGRRFAKRVPGLHVLDDSTAQICGVRFIGSTLSPDAARIAGRRGRIRCRATTSPCAPWPRVTSRARGSSPTRH